MGIFLKTGVHPSYNKHTGGESAKRIEEIRPPESVTIALKQHIGAPCEPTVKVGDTVFVGQVIADSKAFMSAPIHSSVSGTVTKISEIINPVGERLGAITIKSDGEMKLSESVAPPNPQNKEEFLAAVRASGAVGLGGAGFPTHVKLNVPDGKVDALFINAAECEPYITTDERECLDRTGDIIDGIEKVCGFLNIKTAVIGIEGNKPKAAEALKKAAAGAKDVKISVKVLKTIYPQGAEKVLIHSLSGRVVPEGGLPSDVGAIVMNVGTVAFISRYLRTGKPLVSRSLTVDGSAVKSPMNLRVPIGISLKDVFEAAGGFKETPKKILLGGPMMGIAVSGDEDTFITKNNNAALAFNEKDAAPKKETACIRCGRCVKVCPMGLMPTNLEKYYESGNSEGLEKCHALSCIECGCCSFICPAGRNLVASIRLGKAAVRKLQNERKEKEKNG